MDEQPERETPDQQGPGETEDVEAAKIKDQPIGGDAGDEGLGTATGGQGGGVGKEPGPGPESSGNETD